MAFTQKSQSKSLRVTSGRQLDNHRTRTRDSGCYMLFAFGSKSRDDHVPSKSTHAKKNTAYSAADDFLTPMSILYQCDSISVECLRLLVSETALNSCGLNEVKRQTNQTRQQTAQSAHCQSIGACEPFPQRGQVFFLQTKDSA